MGDGYSILRAMARTMNATSTTGLRQAATLIVLVWWAQLVLAQSPYRLAPGADLPILGTEITLVGINIGLHKSLAPLAPADTVGLDVLGLPMIDRHVTRNWSRKAQSTSDILLRSSPLVPLTLPLLAGRSSRHRMNVSYAIVLQGMLGAYALTEVTKLIVKRKRPYTYGQSSFDGELFDRNAKKSFFSGHASYTAVNYYMGAKMFHDFYPDSKWGPAVWATAALVPAITAWKRVQGGKHFVTDVLVGYLVGAAAGILVPELHRNL